MFISETENSEIPQRSPLIWLTDIVHMIDAVTGVHFQLIGNAFTAPVLVACKRTRVHCGLWKLPGEITTENKHFAFASSSLVCPAHHRQCVACARRCSSLHQSSTHSNRLLRLARDREKKTALWVPGVSRTLPTSAKWLVVFCGLIDAIQLLVLGCQSI